MPRSISALPVSVIGAGCVGTALSMAMAEKGFRFVSVISRSLSSARTLAHRLHCKNFSNSIADLDSHTQLLMFAVPEDALSSLAANVASTKSSLKYAFHVSGSETSDVLEPLATEGVITFSLHPIQTFPPSSSIQSQLKSLKGITYGFEGANPALPFARKLVALLDGKMMCIPKEKKILYHIVCVIASNYSVAMLGVVEELLQSVTKDSGLALIKPLIDTSITNAVTNGSAAALTGPVSRGSIATLVKHIETLQREFPHVTDLYTTLGLQALRLAQKDKRITADEAALIEKIFKEG